MLHFNCPDCGKAWNAPDESGGKTLRCSCGSTLTLPKVVQHEPGNEPPKQVKKTSRSKQATVTSDPLQFTGNTTAAYNPGSYARRKKTKLGPALVLISTVVAFVVAVGVLIWAIKSKTDDAKRTSEKTTERTTEKPDRRKVDAYKTEPTKYESRTRADEQTEEWYDRYENYIRAKNFAYLVIITPFYLAPSIVAVIRKHNNLGPIMLINILLGCTFVGWVVALAWSFTDLSAARQKQGPY